MNTWQTIRHKEASGTNVSIIEIGNVQQFAKRLTVLVVDDNPVVLELAASIVEELGYQVVMAGDGFQALLQLKAAPCQLVLTDYEMPSINGYQLAKKVKSQFAETRVVIMTGLCQDQVTELMEDREIDGWLFKPFNLELLKAMLWQVGFPETDKSKARLTS